MTKRQRLFSVAIAVTRLNPEFDQEVSDANHLFIFRRRAALCERMTPLRPDAKGGPIEFRVGSVAVVAPDLSEALKQGAMNLALVEIRLVSVVLRLTVGWWRDDCPRSVQ